jgi:hypothetical protein
VPPVGDEVKLVAGIISLSHAVIFAGTITVGAGFTVTVNVLVGPEQLAAPLLNAGVTVIVAIIGVVPVLMAVNEGMLPLPDVKPIDGVLFVQLYAVVPPVLVVPKVIMEVELPLQTVKFAG